MKIHPTHILYTEHDFTVAEYRRKNILAIAVCDDGAAICKQCGKKEGELDTQCKAAMYLNGDSKWRF